jgi:predicted HicB family RNase H-like nuclease
MMEYKGYVAVFEFDPTVDAFHGEVANTVDTITFEGRSVDELRAAFHESVDDYLELCEREGRRPDHPYAYSRGGGGHDPWRPGSVSNAGRAAASIRPGTR